MSQPHSRARPRRSCLYMPGANPKALEKAKGIPADVLIFDLEDSVAPDAKTEARARVCEALARGGYGGREIVIRVNALSTPWGYEDVEAAAAASPSAVLFPKIETPDDILAAQDVLAAARGQGVGLWAMIETPLAVLSLREIAAQSQNTALEAFVMGVNDLAKDLRASQGEDRLAFLTALSLTVAAARAYGLTPIDGVHNDIEDRAGFEAVCRQGLTLGFDGKTLIHPSQVEACNGVFAPSAEEIAWAQEVIAAFEAPENAGKGVLKVGGRMTERLHLEQARRLVAIADAIAGLA